MMLYLIWLGTPHDNPHCLSAIVQACSNCPLLQTCSSYLLPSFTTPPACLPSQKTLLLRCLKAKAVAQGDVDGTSCTPVALGSKRHGMGRE